MVGLVAHATSCSTRGNPPVRPEHNTNGSPPTSVRQDLYGPSSRGGGIIPLLLDRSSSSLGPIYLACDSAYLATSPLNLFFLLLFLTRQDG